ncbi:MAG: hypothetical protein ACLSFT_05995 [Ruminococcus callidus]
MAMAPALIGEARFSGRLARLEIRIPMTEQEHVHQCQTDSQNWSILPAW